MIVLNNLKFLPEKCYDCPCHNGEHGYCQADVNGRSSEWRPFWCPLVELKGFQLITEQQ